MKKPYVFLIALLMLSAASSCVSNPPRQEVASLSASARILEEDELKRFSRGDLNPFKEWESLLSKPDHRFVAVELELTLPGDERVELAEADAAFAGGTVTAKLLARDELLAYWKLNVDETVHQELLRQVDRRALQRSFKAYRGKTKTGLLVLSIPKDTPPVEECRIYVSIGSKVVEIVARR